ncbi:MAG: hypothetical protein GY821_10920, partial [Gammaproteobacteria bacterium]|nr:hypothetical protein [Gammaproteobacteria bacterium]
MKKAYNAYKSKSNSQLKSGGEHGWEAYVPPKPSVDPQPQHSRAQACRVCQSVMHRAANCPHDPNPQRNFSNVRQDRGFYPQNTQSTQRPQASGGNQNFGQTPRFDNPTRGFQPRPSNYNPNFNQGRGQGYNPQGNRNPNWADSRPPPQRGPNEVPYRGNFAPRGPN